MNGSGNRRTWSIVLAASLGLNLALAGILIYQGATADTAFERRLDEWRSSRRERSGEWQSRYRSERDSTSHFPRLEREQIDRIRALRRDMEVDIEPWRSEINQIQHLIRDELQVDEPSLARLDSLAERTADLQGLIQQRLMRLMLAEREIFTPEQLQFFLRFMVPGQDPYRGGYHRSEQGREGPPRDDRFNGSRGDERRNTDERRTPPPAPEVLPAPLLPVIQA